MSVLLRSEKCIYMCYHANELNIWSDEKAIVRNIYYLAPEIKFIWRPHLLYGARNLNYLAPPLIISSPHLLSGARN